MFILLAFLIFPALAGPVFGEESRTDVLETSKTAEEETRDSEEQSELSLFEDIPVVISASKKPERVTEAPSIISVITEEDITRMGARDIMDVLKTIPGMEIMKDTANISQIAVRGLRSETSAGVKLLVDGHALNDPITGGATTFYDDLSLKNIRRIEIIRGPASALYGANAFVSVVNIITKSAQDIDGLEISGGVGDSQTFNAALLFGKVLNEVELSLYADYYTSDGAKLSIDSDAMSLYDAETPDNFPSISLAPGTFREKREKIDLSGKLKYHDFTLHGRFLDKHRGPFLSNWYAINENSTEDTQHIYVDLEYRRFFTERLEFSGKIYGDYFHLNTLEQVAPGIAILNTNDNDAFIYPNGLIARFQAKSWRIGGEYQISYRLFKNNDLTLGIAYEYMAVEDAHLRTNRFNAVRGYPPDELKDLADLIPDVKTSSFRKFAAVFAQDKWKIRRNVDLTLGIRADYFSDFGGGVITPKIGIRYEPDPSLNIKALFGSAFRVPSFNETFMKRPYQGSPARDDLVVEGLETFEVGVAYKPFNWLIGELNYFYTNITELTEVAEGKETDSYTIRTATRTYQNTGGIDVQGAEVEFRGKSEKEISLGIIPRVISSFFRINYSYQDTKDSMTHEKVPNMARHKGNIGVGLNLSAEQSKDGGRSLLDIFRTFSDEFSVYLNLFLCGKRQRSLDDLRDALPGFAILDMTVAAHNVFHEGLGISFSVENLFDQDYQDPSPEFTEENKYSTIRGDFPNPGRTLFLELRYTF